MKLKENLKSLRKSYVFDCYFTIVYDELEEYEKITRVKMAEKVIQTYQSHPELILQILSEEELRFLKIIPKDGYIVSDNEMQLAGKVCSTFLARWDFSSRNLCCIPEELWATVQNVFKDIQWDDVKLNDEVNQFKLGVLKIYGALTTDEFINICTYHDVDAEFETPYIRRFYHYKEVFDDDYIVCDECYEIEDTLLYKIRESQSKLYIKSKDYIMRIGKDSFDFSNTDIQKFYNFVVNSSATLKKDTILEQFFCACHLNEINYFIHNIKNLYFYSSENEEYKQLFQLSKEAFIHMPSGSLCGATPLENKNQQVAESKSCLSEKDVDLFYKVYFGILEYVNDKYHLFPGYRVYQQQSLNPNTIYSLRSKLFDNRKVFDEFIKKNPFSFNKMELDLVRGFKRGIKDQFIVVRHDEEHSILYDSKNVYGVKGLRSTFNEALQGQVLPIFVETVLLPFGKEVTYDGIVAVMDLSIGKNMKDMLQKEMKHKEIITKL